MDVAAGRAGAEDVVRRSEAEYRSLFEAAAIANAEVELPSGRFVRVNRRYCELVGYSADELLGGMTFVQITHPADRERNLAPLSSITLDQEGHFEIEKRYIRKDGSIVWVHLTATLLRDAEGRPSRLLGSAIDVTDRRAAEESLRAAHDAFRQLVDNSPFGVYVVDADFRLVRVSAGAQKVFQNVRPLIGRDFADVLRTVWVEPFATDAINIFRRTLETGEPYHSPSTVESRRDVSEIESYDWKIARILMPDGRFGVVCHFYDLSERQRYEAALRDSEQRYKQLLGLLPAAVYTCDRSGVITYYNEQATHLWGRAPRPGDTDERFCGSQSLLLPDGTPLPHENCPMAVALRTGERFRDREVQIRRPDGSLVSVMVNIDPILGDTGEITGAINVFHDITALKRAEQALRESERRFRTMADISPVMIWVTNAGGDIEFVNHSYLSFFGVDEEQVRRPGGWKPLMHPDDSAAYVAAFENAIRKRTTFRAEVRVRHADGSWRWIASYAAPRIGANGEFLGHVGSSPDITERKRAEEALREADRRKDEFLATLAHELRNPLAPMMHSLDLLERIGIADVRAIEARATLQRQMTHLVRLVDDLLDISRITRDKLELRRERVELAPLIQHAVEANRALCDTLAHELLVSLPPQPVWIDADSTRLAQVVGNLLNNAAKYTPRGGRIELSARLDDAGQLVLSVADNGMGIPPGELQRIFETFAQAHVAHGQLHGGLGIGLSLVKRLVEMHGGTVLASSDGRGRGSTFTVRLPVTDAPAPHDPAPEADAYAATAHAEPAHAGQRILIVDDNRDTARSMARLLMLGGHLTHTAHDGPEALAAAEQFAPDLVLLDIGLPSMSGYDVCREIRRKLTGKPPVIIALTGWGQEEDRRKSAEAGFDHHLVKPVQFQKLTALLGELSNQA